MEPSVVLRQRARSLVCMLAAAVLCSCGGSTPAAPSSTAASASITGAATLSENKPSVQLALVVNSTSAAPDLTASALWQSSDPKVATVSRGFVQATAPGTATISATYNTLSATTSITVAQDDDCETYPASDLELIQNTNDQPPSWTVALTRSGILELLAGADNSIDANNLLALFQRYNEWCFIGRSNARPNRQQYMLSYFKLPNGNQPTIAPEDCVSYNPTGLQVVSEGATGWALMGGGNQLGLLDTSLEATLALNVAQQASRECFIGRGNTRKNPYRYITEYWQP